jgi:hypothetical protein
MAEMVEARRSADTKEEHRDLFSGLLDATGNDQDITQAMTEPELICTCQMSHCIDRAYESSHSPPSKYVRLPSRWT